MFLKLVKVYGKKYDYNDDTYEDIFRYIVLNDSDFEEINDSDHDKLIRFVDEYNARSNAIGEKDCYLIIYKDSPTYAKDAIAHIIEKDKKILEERKEKERKLKIKTEKEKEERLLRQKQRIEKQLSKLAGN
jgi:hypothetical protein